MKYKVDGDAPLPTGEPIEKLVNAWKPKQDNS